MFGLKNKAKVNYSITDNEFSWSNNSFKIEDDFLIADGLLNNFRVPLNSIETVVWSRNPMKPEVAISMRIVGKGVVLVDADVPFDRVSEVQNWILNRIA